MIEDYAFVEFRNLRVLNIGGAGYAMQFISDDAFYGLNYLHVTGNYYCVRYIGHLMITNSGKG